jgi:Uma2 family endonuclease
MQTEFPILGAPPERMPMSERRYTIDEYLAFERGDIERHVYLDGKIFEMGGETWGHGDISVNLIASVGLQLKGKPCRARTKLTKVHSSPIPAAGDNTSGMFSYPDIVVICDGPEHFDGHTDIILNPKAVIEVLSPSTEIFDRGEKFARYRTCNPTFTDYVLVAQDRPNVEHFQRLPDSTWLYRHYIGLEAIVPIASIGCTLKLADVYDRVTFPEE